jgi:hypothetical protein
LRTKENTVTKPRNLPVIYAAICCLTCAQFMKAGDGCPELEGKDTATHLEYLHGDRPKLAAACVVAAIKYLGVKPHSAQASAVLIEYLDYPDPRYEGRAGKGSTILYGYPAADVLSSFGRSVVPELLVVIAAANSSELLRRNAAFTIGLLYGLTRPDPIDVLVSAAHEQVDPIAANRLMDQARWLAARCIPEYRNACENAVLK